MIDLTVAELLTAVGGRWAPAEDVRDVRDVRDVSDVRDVRDVSDVSDPAAIWITGEVRLDSRSCVNGDVFLAMAGEHADGHDHAEAAHRAGAVVVIGTRAIPGVPCAVVADPVAALGGLAAAVLARLPDLVVIGITGSSGKTSTKDLIGDLLPSWGPTVSAVGSYNNDLGVPLTVLHADEHTRFLVLEMGSRGIGHITRLTAIARPKIGVILNIGTAHLGEFGSTDVVAQAKSELVDALPTAAEGGVAILNADDAACAFLASRTAAQVWTFGTGPDADIRFHRLSADAGGRPSFRLSAGGHDAEVSLQLVGAHQAANAAAACGVALATFARTRAPASLDSAVGQERLDEIAQLLRAARPRSRWRMELTERPDGVSILNDAYNANPESMRAALDTLVAIAGEGRRSWAVLGGMGELGARAETEHRLVGATLRSLGIDRLVAVGSDASGIYAGAAGGPAMEEGFSHVPDISAALHLLHSQLRPGDVVLIKASRYVGLERLADALIDGATGA